MSAAPITAPSEDVVGVMNAYLPFLRHIGIEFVTIDPHAAVVRLPDQPTNGNGHGSVYAGALAALGEAATLAALQGLVVPRHGIIPPLLRGQWIRCRQPATGDLTATAAVTTEHRTALADLEQHGRCELTAVATITNRDGDTVAEITADYQVRLPVRPT